MKTTFKVLIFIILLALLAFAQGTDAQDSDNLSTLPWWETMWFRGVLLIILIGLMLGGHRYWGKAFEHRRRQLEIQVKERTKKLQESEEQFRNLFETMAQGVVYQAADGKITSANSAAERILGLTLDQMLGRTSMDPCWKAIHEDGSAFSGKTHPSMIALKSGKEVRNIVMGVFNPLHDEYHWININAVPQFNPGESTPYQVYTTFDDITERKQTEEALKTSELRFRSLIEQTTDAVFCYEYDPPIPTDLPIDEQVKELYRCVLVECNDVCARSYGATQAEEVVGKKLTDLFGTAPDSLDGLFMALIQGEYRIVDGLGTEVLEDGTKRYYLNNGHGVIKDGKLLRVWGTFRDITDRKRAEEALQESEERLKKIIENMPVLFDAFDENGMALFWNKECERVTGYRADEIVGNPKAMELLVPDQTYRNRILEQLQELGHSYHDWELNVRCKNCETRTIAWSNISRDYPISGWWSWGVGVDITERKRTEEQLQLYAAKLEEANAELSQFAYVASHDLKAPLRAIRNYVDFLGEDLEETLGSEQKSYLHGINQAVREANALIEDLLKLSRIDRQRAEIETIEVGSFLRSLVTSLDLPAEVEIVMQDDWPTLEIAPVLCRQIFQNLIGNAIKFNESPQKRVELGWQPVGDDRYEFFVRDNGIGINPLYQKKIFHVFERIHTKEEFEGTGIGLAIVKKVVSKLGGSIRVESTPGEGSTFFVILPRRQEM